MEAAYDNIVQQRLLDLIRRIDPGLSKMLDGVLDCYDEMIQSLIISTRQSYET